MHALQLQTLLAGLLAMLCVSALPARTLPTYIAMSAKVPELWDARYPIKAQSFIANPEKLGILSARHKGRAVYYYHYRATLRRPARKADESLEYKEVLRAVEFWVRYRPGQKQPFDLSFARRDLLPGSNRRWLKSK